MSGPVRNHCCPLHPTLSGESPIQLLRAVGILLQLRKKKILTDSLTVLRSLIAQLGWRRDVACVATPLKELYDNPDEVSGVGKLGIKHCSELLQELAQLLPKTTIVINALDECSNKEGLLKVLHEMVEISAGSHHINILVGSKMHVPVKTWFPECFCVSPADNAEDVANFIDIEVKDHRSHFLGGKVSDEERGDPLERLANVLRERAENI
jgi:hypothetical protein